MEKNNMSCYVINKSISPTKFFYVYEGTDSISILEKKYNGSLDYITAGSFGMIYRVHTYAIKVIDFGLKSGENFSYNFESFISEYNSTIYLNDGRLRDRVIIPNKSYILKIYNNDKITYNGVLEYNYIKAKVSSDKYNIDHIYYILNTLNSLYEMGIYHRDVSLDNTIAIDNYRVLLIDFGATTYIKCNKFKNIHS